MHELHGYQHLGFSHPILQDEDILPGKTEGWPWLARSTHRRIPGKNQG